MKSIAILVIAGCITMAAPAQEISWQLNFEKAKKEAVEQNKPILISFAGSDWCKPCIKLTREVFETDEFKEYAEGNLVLLLLDFPRLKKNALSEEQLAHNEKLAEKYNDQGAFPLVVLVDSEGKVIEKTGYISGGPEPFLAFLQNALK